jgi:hypothetical protein
MAANLHTDSSPSVGELVTGIIHDAQTLMTQQFTLLEQEIRDEFTRAREAAVSLAVASGVLLSGVILLCLMCVYLLHELAHLPLWGSFAVVGGPLTVIGGVLGYLGREQLRTVSPVPEKTAKALEENLEWKTKPTGSASR